MGTLKVTYFINPVADITIVRNAPQNSLPEKTLLPLVTGHAKYVNRKRHVADRLNKYNLGEMLYLQAIAK